MGFLARNFGSWRKEKLTKFQHLGDSAEKTTIDKHSSVLKLNGELLRTVEWGATKGCAVHGVLHNLRQKMKLNNVALNILRK